MVLKKQIPAVLISVLLLGLLELGGQIFYFVRHFPAGYAENRKPKSHLAFSVYGAYDYLPGKPVDLRGLGYPVDFLGVDRYGFVHNGEDRPIEKEDKVILLLGGSSVEGRGASSNRATIAAKLESLFQDRFPESRFRVINAGRSGYIAYQEAAFLSGRVPQILKPRLVIALDGYNDAQTAVGYADFGWKPNWIPYFDELDRDVNRRMTGGAEPLSELRAWLESHSAFAGMLSRFLKPPPPLRMYAPQKKAPGSETLEQAAQAYFANHAAASAAANEWGAPYYVFLQPVLLESRKGLLPEEKQIQTEWEKHYHAPFFWSSLELFYREVLQQGKEKSYFHDLSGLFKKDFRRIYWDHCHYNDSGNQRIAEEIFDVVRKEFERRAGE